MPDVPVLIRTVDDQPVPVAIDDVLVQVFDEADVFITSGYTGALTPGEIEFSLPGEVGGIAYILRFFKAGVSFLPQPRVDITVYDVPPATTEVVGHVGDDSVLATLVAESDDTTPVPIPGTIFKIFGEGDTFLTQLVADLQGEAEIQIAPDSYIVRLLSPGWTFVNGPSQTIEVLNPPPVGGTNTFEFPAHRPSMPQATDPNMCLMSGYFVDVAMRPLRNLRLRFMPILNDPDFKMSGFPGAGDPAVVVRKQIFNEAVFETDETGYVEVQLPRASCYDVHIHGYEHPGVPHYGQIYVPDAAGAYIEDVLFPYPTSVTFDPTSLSMLVGESKATTPTILGSNLQTLGNQYAMLFMDFTIADPTVAGMVQNSDGSINISGLAPGSTTLSVARSSTKTTFVPRRPDIPALVMTPVTIVVT